MNAELYRDETFSAGGRKTHYMDSRGDLLCGRFVEEEPQPTRDNTMRATCVSCLKAGERWVEWQVQINGGRRV